MKITNTLSVTMKKDDCAIEIESCGMILHRIETTDPRYNVAKDFYDTVKSFDKLARERAYADGKIVMPTFTEPEPTIEEAEPAPEPPVKSAKEILVEGLNNLINFFSEFSFTPSFRFVNTLSYMISRDRDAAKSYVSNYFALTDSAYLTDINDKIKSREFDLILDNIAQYGTPDNHVNSRMKVYYGAAGTGKTTLAQTETENRCIVCNASMLPADLMEDFIFKDGQPSFNPSMLYDCMEKGLPIVLDEINLLPFDSLRFLQGITDGKKTVVYKNRTINIADGFQIIGTMNLSLGGAVYGLPEPLVDRCSEIREFNLTAEQLSVAIIGNREE